MTLFLFALVLGACLIGLVAFGVVDHHDGFDHSDGFLSLNLRGIAYGATVFGLLGAGLTVMGLPSVIIWPVSVALGIGTMLGVTALFQWLRRSESGHSLQEGAWYGLEATLVVPFDRISRLGRISTVVGGQVHELTATWPDTAPLPDLPAGAQVIIERLDQGVAVLSTDSWPTTTR